MNRARWRTRHTSRPSSHGSSFPRPRRGLTGLIQTGSATREVGRCRKACTHGRPPQRNNGHSGRGAGNFRRCYNGTPAGGNPKTIGRRQNPPHIKSSDSKCLYINRANTEMWVESSERRFRGCVAGRGTEIGGVKQRHNSVNIVRRWVGGKSGRGARMGPLARKKSGKEGAARGGRQEREGCKGRPLGP
jgi:hypothetical protein